MLELRRVLRRDVATLNAAARPRPVGRFARWPVWAARSMLVLLAMAIAYGVAVQLGRDPPAPTASAVGGGDAALYRAIASRVSAGGGYYPAAVAEQSARNYPLRPFVAVRPPTLAWWTALVGFGNATLAFRLLGLAAVAAFAWRMWTTGMRRAEWLGASLLAAMSVALAANDAFVVWHESWAALLIALSLACRTPSRWVPSLVVGFAAACFRELAAPFMLVMAVLAWREGNRTEAIGWTIALGIFGLLLAAHGAAVAAHIPASAPVSQGWWAAGGYGFLLRLVHGCTLLVGLPVAAAAFALPLALVGWASLRHQFADRMALMLAGFLATFSVMGRPENFYWGLLIAPLLLPGLAFAPRALRDLARAAVANRASLAAQARNGETA